MPEVEEAKSKESQNQMKYDVFEEVDYSNQVKIRSRWVITQK